ncbi:tRNA (N6-isopentenyl adenosine(37)-C2)-methylthiotransferase MiaB [Prosthecochloris sp. GSB1]|uniref:MiaB/RimO family radical SAM methylthiotransferase n=1 Tax=Prosthecochloris sp. GSB1 TaxID=281093 RepID=UPI000B8C7DD4|nr:MiaB/RimO family radical SAM methylthiotransferase [Prosthecochloris sp. GSB1]ASQ89917.1 tRNA (N6-isopentenyl adenosine(37)-C2)-methylthiotransferase MiaB [Prosthecochloris sp. GSB1]
MQKKKRVLAVTLGCKLNYAETSAILEGFIRAGWEIAGENDFADLVIVHTCGVTGQAGRKSRQQVRKMMKRYPESRIAVVGCYAQLEPDVVERLGDVDVILGSREKFLAGNYEQPADGGVRRDVSTLWSSLDGVVPARSLIHGRSVSRTRAFLKIQDGCDYGCSYCAIPLARGRSRSIGLDAVLADASSLADAGYREIVLTGVNIADYRYNGATLPDLLLELESVNVPRIRISSIEPDRCDDRLLETVAASSKIMPHFHLPLQGGSDAILAAMRRRYTVSEYREKFLRAVDAIADGAIGADVMTGYPGESEKDFESMYALLEGLPVAYLHVFPCSVRPSTLLAREVEKGARATVPADTVHRRSRLLLELGEKKKREFVERHVGRTLQVLFETSESGICSGYSGNYIRVGVQGGKGGEAERFVGREATVLAERIAPGLYLEGRIVT